MSAVADGSGKARVVVAAPLPDDLRRRLAEQCTIVADLGAVVKREDFEASLRNADGVLTTIRNRIDENLLDRNPRLRVVSNVAVGLDNIDPAAASRHGVTVCNTPGVLDGAVADLAMLLMLGVARRVRQSDAHLRNGTWLSRPVDLGTDVSGKTLGLLGLGRIGRAVAQRARAFDMRVISYDPHPGPACDVPLVDREQLFREADFVSLHCPLTSETQRSVGAAEFKLMKPSAVLINTARGAIVDQAALLEALEKGTIAGAGLDVMEREPLAPDDPLCKLDNVLLLPHIGSATVETRRAMTEIAVSNLLAALRPGGGSSAGSVDIA